ncbi:carbohydrate binding-domain-containing protein [Mycena amicta]|nr:carbohydrate binding-domain-containing protein [Mycena amicta]
MPCSRSRLTCLVLAAVLAATVSAQTLLDCGESRYFPSQYTCFDGDFLCPITDDVDFLRCGLACYNTQDYACSNSTLEQNTHDPNQLLACGEAFFSPLKYDCFDGTFLCPKYEGEASLRCGDACYFTEQYTCNADDAPRAQGRRARLWCPTSARAKSATTLDASRRLAALGLLVSGTSAATRAI